MNVFQSKEMFDLLLSLGGGKLLNELPNPEGFSPLLAALSNVRCVTDDIVLRILEDEGVDVNLEGNQLPLTMAIRKNRSVAVIERLVSRGADVNRREESSRLPPLVLAVAASGLCPAEAAVEGAPAGDRTTDTAAVGAAAATTVPCSPASSEGVGRSSEVAKSVVPVFDDDETLPWQLEVAAILVDNGADVLLEDGAGFSALTRCFSPKLFQLLLDRAVLARAKIDSQPAINNSRYLVNHVCSANKTPLVLAAGCNNVPMIEVLVHRNADVNLFAPCTPLIAAAANCHKEAVELLLRHGADCSLAFENKVAEDYLDVKDPRYAELKALLSGRVS